MACQNNPATTVKIPAAIKAKGYSNTEVLIEPCRDRALQKLKGVISAAAPAAFSEAAMGTNCTQQSQQGCLR